MKKQRKPRPKRKQRLVIGNWKMNPQTIDEAKEILRAVKRKAARLARTKTVVCPPFIYLSELSKLSKGAVPLGVQNAHWEAAGSHTGEVSAEQAANLGASYCILGHSERRAMGETDEEVAKKILSALRSGMRAVVCVGERTRDHEAKYLDFLAEQIRGSFAGVMKRDLDGVIVAYEPVWAIGKSDSEAMTGKDLYETTLYVRKVLAGMYGKDLAFGIPILYGGSVTYRNAEDIVSEGQVDGLLVGRQSLETEGYLEMLSIVDSLS